MMNVIIHVCRLHQPNSFYVSVLKDGSGPNSELRYSIEHHWPETPDLLNLDPSSGVLTLGQNLDRESTPSLYVVVRATDQAVDPSQRRWGSVTARVFVTDENDNAPLFSSPSAVSVMEDQPVGSVSFLLPRKRETSKKTLNVFKSLAGFLN